MIFDVSNSNTSKRKRKRKRNVRDLCFSELLVLHSKKMALENKILEQRLIYKDSVIGVSSLSRCAKALSCLKGSKENEKAGLESFVRELLLFQLELNKAQRILKSTGNQYREYEQIQNEIIESIDSTKQEIQQLNTDLSHARLIRQHRLDCERAAEDVTKFQPRSYLNKKMEELNESMRLCEKRTSHYEGQIEQRNTQFQQLVSALIHMEGRLTEIDENRALEGVDEEADQETLRSDREREIDGDDKVEEEKLNDELVEMDSIGNTEDITQESNFIEENVDM